MFISFAQKKIALALVSALLLSSWPLIALRAQESASAGHQEAGAVFEVKAGHFFFLDSTFRDIYRNGGTQFQLSGTYPWMEFSERHAIAFYASLGFLDCRGKSLSAGQKSTLRKIPCDLGLQHKVAITPKVNYSCAVGPRYAYLQQHNESDEVDRKLSCQGPGLFVNMNLGYQVVQHWSLALLAEYSYERAYFKSHREGVVSRSAPTGGLMLGASISYNL